MSLPAYKEVWAVDFEFHCPDGSRPNPICMVAAELGSGREIRLNESQLRSLGCAPFDVGADSLFIAYYASAEFGCFLELGWELPVNVVDLYVEFRNRTNGLPTPCGQGLLGALSWFGLPPADAVEKREMRELAMRGGPYSPGEMEALLDYCASDVKALARLWPVMAPSLTLPSLLRGRYMKAVARMERTGTPLDVTVSELAIEAFYPEDETTAAALRALPAR